MNPQFIIMYTDRAVFLRLSNIENVNSTNFKIYLNLDIEYAPFSETF